MWRALSLALPSPRRDLLHNIDEVNQNAALRDGPYKLVLSPASAYDQHFRIMGGSRPQNDLDALMAKSDAAKALRRFYNTGSLAFPRNWRHSAMVDCGHHEDDNFVSGKSPYVFDLDNDPCELKNLAENRKRVRQLFCISAIVITVAIIITYNVVYPTLQALRPLGYFLPDATIVIYLFFFFFNLGRCET